jgi:hypothetical protein
VDLFNKGVRNAVNDPFSYDFSQSIHPEWTQYNDIGDVSNMLVLPREFEKQEYLNKVTNHGGLSSVDHFAPHFPHSNQSNETDNESSHNNRPQMPRGGVFGPQGRIFPTVIDGETGEEIPDFFGMDSIGKNYQSNYQKHQIPIEYALNTPHNSTVSPHNGKPYGYDNRVPPILQTTNAWDHYAEDYGQDGQYGQYGQYGSNYLYQNNPQSPLIIRPSNLTTIHSIHQNNKQRYWDHRRPEVENQWPFQAFFDKKMFEPKIPMGFRIGEHGENIETNNQRRKQDSKNNIFNNSDFETDNDDYVHKYGRAGVAYPEYYGQNWRDLKSNDKNHLYRNYDQNGNFFTQKNAQNGQKKTHFMHTEKPKTFLDSLFSYFYPTTTPENKSTSHLKPGQYISLTDMSQYGLYPTKYGPNGMDFYKNIKNQDHPHFSLNNSTSGQNFQKNHQNPRSYFQNDVINYDSISTNNLHFTRDRNESIYDQNDQNFGQNLAQNKDNLYAKKPPKNIWDPYGLNYVPYTYGAGTYSQYQPEKSNIPMMDRYGNAISGHFENINGSAVFKIDQNLGNFNNSNFGLQNGLNGRNGRNAQNGLNGLNDQKIATYEQYAQLPTPLTPEDMNKEYLLQQKRRNNRVRDRYFDAFDVDLGSNAAEQNFGQNNYHNDQQSGSIGGGLLATGAALVQGFLYQGNNTNRPLGYRYSNNNGHNSNQNYATNQHFNQNNNNSQNNNQSTLSKIGNYVSDLAAYYGIGSGSSGQNNNNNNNNNRNSQNSYHYSAGNFKNWNENNNFGKNSNSYPNFSQSYQRFLQNYQDELKFQEQYPHSGVYLTYDSNTAQIVTINTKPIINIDNINEDLYKNDKNYYENIQNLLKLKKIQENSNFQNFDPNLPNFKPFHIPHTTQSFPLDFNQFNDSGYKIIQILVEIITIKPHSLAPISPKSTQPQL